MANSARAIVQRVLPQKMADEIWSARYDKVLPISLDFELSAVLPAVFYMFRFGQRRGRGKFVDTFGPKNGSPRERRRATTVDRVAERLASSSDLDGFNDDVERVILGDLLLGFSLENIKHELGRDKQVQRVAPAHYMASWIDLPESVAHLRFVPEMVVAILADQKGDYVKRNESGDRTWFPVATGHEENLLLQAFNHGVTQDGFVANLAADKFDERNKDIGIDQLLMIRLAKSLGVAPKKAGGKQGSEISNQRPIAERAARHFSEDIRRFVRAYASVIPRHIFVDTLEACVATSMTAILTSVIEILFEWVDTGAIIEKNDQRPASIFVDCSNGVDKNLRNLAERSLDDLMRRIERVPVILMMLRLLDYAARDNKKIKKQDIPTRPYATAWLNLLGDLLYQRYDKAPFVHHQMDEYGEKLADDLSGDYPEAAEALRNEQGEPNPIRRLATALTPLLGASARGSIISAMDSTLNVGRPNGLAHKRRTTSGTQVAGSGRRQREVRSLVFTDAILDYLVHLHILPSGGKRGVRPLSLTAFLDAIRNRYGFHVDTAPPGMIVSNDLLRTNRMVLERRLRDLGLLVGVNDAEAMKRLRPRFEPGMED